MNLTRSKRLVVKVGSALIAPDQDGCSTRYLGAIAEFIERCRSQSIDVVLVSSGSVAAGNALIKGSKDSMATKKAMAAAGQTQMMSTWDSLFSFPIAQVLLTHADLRHRDRFVAIRNTINTLLANDILPVVNENDTVTTDKLRVGDNDNLSAMVASAADADTLVICSDVNGLYDKNPHTHSDATLLSLVTHIDERILGMAGDATSAVGTGGMRTKVQAAEKATAHGIGTYIVNGFEAETFSTLLQGNNPGTYFEAFEQPMQELEHWLTHTSNAQGELIVEDSFLDNLHGSNQALNGDELVSVEGDFAIGDTVLIKDTNGAKLAKAKTNYSSCLLNFIAEQDNLEIEHNDGMSGEPIIAPDDIALLED